MSTHLGELDDPAPPVLRVGCPPEEFSRFQAIDRGSDRTAREQNFPPDDIHRLRSLVQKHFQYREVGTAETQRRHASNSVLLDGVGRLPQYQPDTGCRFTARTWNGDRQRRHLPSAPRFRHIILDMELWYAEIFHQNDEPSQQVCASILMSRYRRFQRR